MMGIFFIYLKIQDQKTKKRDQVFYLPIKKFFFHIEAAQITYKNQLFICLLNTIDEVF